MTMLQGKPVAPEVGRSDAVALGGVALAVIGMMLVIGGVLTAGLYMPGVVLILVGLLALALSGILHLMESGRRE